eukprot:3025082-Pyramimonas_sp.AAC.1
MASDAGVDFSFRTLMHPLPTAAFEVLARVLSCVPRELAPPFVKACLRQNHNVEARENIINSVLWKLRSHVGVGCAYDYDLNNPVLKEMQAACLESETVCLPSTHGWCPECQTTELVKQTGRSRGSIAANWKEGNADARSCEFRFRVYTLGAGVQFCTFREEHCPSCKHYFIGNWKYKKNAGSGGRANFGKMTDITTVVTQTALPYVVVPREKAWYAVDLQLLQFITDDLHHSGGTFTSAIHVWAGKHPEQAQQNLILGEDMTQTCHTRVRLEDA